MRLLLGSGALVAGYLFLRGCLAMDARGLPVLGFLATPVDFVRSLGLEIGETVSSAARASWWVVLAAASLVLALPLGIRRLGFRRDAVPWFVVFGSVGAGLLLHSERVGAFVAVSSVVGFALLAVTEEQRDERRVPGIVWGLVAVLLSAVTVRFYALDRFPSGFAEHAMLTHTFTLHIHDHLLRALSAPNGRGLIDLYDYVLSDRQGTNALISALFFKALGTVNMTAAAMVTATIGSLAVWGAYLFGSAALDRKTGLLFAFLLAFSPWHITASRYGDSEFALSGFQAVWLFYSLTRASRHGGWFWVLAAAFFTGFAWYIYPANQSTILIVIAFGLYKMVSSDGFIWRNRWKLLAFLLLFGVLSVPPIVARTKAGFIIPVNAFIDPENQNSRLARPDELLPNALEALRQCFLRVQDTWFHQPGGGLGIVEAALLPGALILCAAGLFVRAYRDVAVLTGLWLAFSFVAGIFGRSMPFHRLFLFALAALFVAAVAIRRTLAAVRASRLGSATGPLVILLGVLYAVFHTHAYFDRVSAFESDKHAYLTETAKRVRPLLGEAFLYVVVAEYYEAVDVSRYVRVEAHGELERLQEGRGLQEEALYQPVLIQDLKSVLARPKRLDGRTIFVASVRDRRMFRTVPGLLEKAVGGMRGTPYFDPRGNYAGSVYQSLR